MLINTEPSLLRLLNHEADIPRLPTNLSDNTRDPYAGYSKEQLREESVHIRLIGPPGEQKHYSNLGYALLGVAIEEIEGEALEAVFSAWVE
ncbi:hypothetical protein LH51_06080 [Nitrincola sp. A-D6]|nr:hypothetical protein LH51_06080 [Nitrincola sp. A-D6]